MSLLAKLTGFKIVIYNDLDEKSVMDATVISKQLKNSELEFLARNSRGLREDDIEKMVNDYIIKGETNYMIDHPTNTCDPYTGSWTEKLIYLKQLKSFLENNNLLVDITGSLYCYSNNKILNIIKFFLNQLIKMSDQKSLFFSPTITLEIQK